MYLQRIGAVVAFLCFFLEAVWAQECANITITSQDHADEVRKSCKTIEGYLKFDDYLDESIKLDGIEFVNGDITHSGDPEYGDATEIGGPYPTKLKPITIECSTLKTVNGSIYFWAFDGLSELLLPELTRIEEAFTLQRMHYLRKLDITKLTHLGSVNIEANHLVELKHEELKGFTGGAWTPGVQFWGVRVSNLDSWFKYPLTAISRGSGYDDLSTWAPVKLNANSIPNLRNVTVGYANTSKISVYANKTELTLGGPETETMDIGLLQLEGDLTKLSRAPNVKELNVRQLYLKDSSLKEIDLTIFDKITNLTIYHHENLQRIRMPPKAVDWEDMTIDIEVNQNLTLVSEYRDPENKKDQFWYWPKGNISRINIIGTPLSTGFFDSFLAARNGSNPPKVLDYFYLAQAPLQWSEPMGFNCTPFEELYNKSVLPEKYKCLNYNSLSSASHVWMSWGFVGVALLLSVVYLS